VGWDDITSAFGLEVDMRLRVGKVMAVRFWDHVEDGSEPIEFTVYGRVAKVTDQYICVDSWEYVDRDKGYDSNVKRFTILRSCVVQAREVK
jgi:hypothetical protein